MASQAPKTRTDNAPPMEETADNLMPTSSTKGGKRQRLGLPKERPLVPISNEPSVPASARSAHAGGTQQPTADTTLPQPVPCSVAVIESKATAATAANLSSLQYTIGSSRIVCEPEPRQIYKEELVSMVKRIFSGLVKTESVSKEEIKLQFARAQAGRSGLNGEHYGKFNLRQTRLIGQYHDFIEASQHPLATPKIKGLVKKHQMLERLWEHGIDSYLRLLRLWPDSGEHLLQFVYLAYSFIGLLYEAVPTFKDVWAERLGDLAGYRLAVEDDIRDREVWTQVAQQWYLEASDRSPGIGRFYYRLAILARPNSLKQLLFYSKALSVDQPYIAARESILTVFDLDRQKRRERPIITAFIKVYAILFTQNNPERFDIALAEYISLLDSYIASVTWNYLQCGYEFGISNCLALLFFGSPESLLFKELSIADDPRSAPPAAIANDVMFNEARQLFVQTAGINLQRLGDPNILPFLHVLMVFMVYISQSARAVKLLEKEFPWHSLVVFLNTLLRFYRTYHRIEGDEFPVPKEKNSRPLPEDFAMRGLFWTTRYFKEDWFLNKNIEYNNQYREDALMNTSYRPERILWLGCQLAKLGRWIGYRQVDHEFFHPDCVTAHNSIPPTASLKTGQGSEGESEDDVLEMHVKSMKLQDCR